MTGSTLAERLSLVRVLVDRPSAVMGRVTRVVFDGPTPVPEVLYEARRCVLCMCATCSFFVMYDNVALSAAVLKLFEGSGDIFVITAGKAERVKRDKLGDTVPHQHKLGMFEYLEQLVFDTLRELERRSITRPFCLYLKSGRRRTHHELLDTEIGFPQGFTLGLALPGASPAEAARHKAQSSITLSFSGHAYHRLHERHS